MEPWPVCVRTLKADIAQVAADGAECVMTDLDEVVGAMSPASEPYTLHNYPFFVFLADDGDLDTDRPLLSFRPHFCHCRRDSSHLGVQASQVLSLPRRISSSMSSIPPSCRYQLYSTPCTLILRHL